MATILERSGVEVGILVIEFHCSLSHYPSALKSAKISLSGGSIHKGYFYGVVAQRGREGGGGGGGRYI